MKNIFTITFYIVTLLFTGNVTAGGGVNSTKISHVAFQSNHFFIYSSGWNNANDCQETTAVVLQSSNSNFDKAYTLLLAAFMSGKNVSGYSDGCIEWDGRTYNTIRGHKYLTVWD